ncbi:MAG TPA: hypothetical protein VNK73_08175 [Actinomycetota bacterium]|nr:hypothetical protein [Actinomycetota bacterium]
MRFSRQRHVAHPGGHPVYVGRHQARRRGGVAGALSALLRGGVAGLVALLILAMLVIATLIVVSSSPPSSRGTAAPPASPATAAPPTSPPTAAPTTPPRPKVTLIAARSFRDGVQPWKGVPGSLLNRGELGKPNVSYARIQPDPINPPATDPSTGKSMVGIYATVPNVQRAGIQVQAVIRLRVTKPGTMVVVRLSEWQGTRRVGRQDGRVTMLDTKWRQITSDYRVLQSGSQVKLEILALALDLDHELFIEPPVVTGA